MLLVIGGNENDDDSFFFSDGFSSDGEENLPNQPMREYCLLNFVLEGRQVGGMETVRTGVPGRLVMME